VYTALVQGIKKEIIALFRSLEEESGCTVTDRACGERMMPDRIGERFAQAVADKDARALEALLTPDIDFRAMTPRQFWEASPAAAVVHEIIFGKWFTVADHIEASEVVGTSTIADCHRVGYRLRLTNSTGSFVVEQPAFFGVVDGRIGWLRIMCSGFRRRSDSTGRG
jgi:hypothetical protein